jgi:nuclear pore complex protein Nup37
VHAIAWSPKTSLCVVPKIVTFGIAGADFKIRLYNSDLNENHEFEVINLV